MSRSRPYAFPKALRWEVFARDKQCVLATLEPGHQCFDVWHQPHAANDFDRLTIEHVKLELGMSAPRIHDAAHCLTLCGFANFSVPSKEQRRKFREYLSAFGPSGVEGVTA